MDETTYHYYGNNNPVRVGDRILVRPLIGRAKLGTIIYIPGQSKPDSGLGDDRWAYKLDNGGVYAGGFSPKQISSPGKRIEFVSRPGDEANEVIQSYRIPSEEPDDQPGRNFLAFIGCGALIAITIVLAIGLWRWFSGGR